MKAKNSPRQIFVFTTEEKKTAACVMAALLLGLAVKYYRETHPQPTQQLSERQQDATQRAARAATARARSARAQAAATRTNPTPNSSPTDDEED